MRSRRTISRTRALSYSDRVPWTPTQRRIVPRRGGMLYRYRDEDGVDWWSDNIGIFQGEAPDYLKQAYRAAGLPVDVESEPRMLSFVRMMPGILLDAPVAAYEVTSETERDVVPVAVFAETEHDPELHVDARYLAYAESRFPDAMLWRAGGLFVAVRRTRALLGYVEGRALAPERGRQS